MPDYFCYPVTQRVHPLHKKLDLLTKGISPVSATVAQAINFLAELVKSGVGYSGVNTARSAISTIIIVVSDSATFGTLPLVKRFLKGVF